MSSVGHRRTAVDLAGRSSPQQPACAVRRGSALQPRRAGVRHSAQQVLPGDGGSGAKWTVPVLSRYHAPLLAAARFAGNSLIWS